MYNNRTYATIDELKKKSFKGNTSNSYENNEEYDGFIFLPLDFERNIESKYSTLSTECGYISDNLSMVLKDYEGCIPSIMGNKIYVSLFFKPVKPSSMVEEYEYGIIEQHNPAQQYTRQDDLNSMVRNSIRTKKAVARYRLGDSLKAFLDNICPEINGQKVDWNRKISEKVIKNPQGYYMNRETHLVEIPGIPIECLLTEVYGKYKVKELIQTEEGNDVIYDKSNKYKYNIFIGQPVGVAGASIGNTDYAVVINKSDFNKTKEFVDSVTGGRVNDIGIKLY